ncbi:hypothetical protein IWW57_002980 [Coemansia sp. S610]|nr:hypothetical protein IWW57_002980 [Coemansia sp. S610]
MRFHILFAILCLVLGVCGSTYIGMRNTATYKKYTVRDNDCHAIPEIYLKTNEVMVRGHKAVFYSDENCNKVAVSIDDSEWTNVEGFIRSFKVPVSS